MKSWWFFGLIFLISLASAADYSAEFRQIGDSITVKEVSNNYETVLVDSSLLDRSQNGYYFTKKIIFNQNYSNVKITLVLDKGYYFDIEGIFPEGNVDSDGEKIYLTWQRYNVSKGDSFSMFVKIINARNSNLWIAAFVLAVVILLVILLMNFNEEKRARKISREKNKTSKTFYLLDTERKVIDELKKVGKEGLWQRKIQEITGFSKAKVSRLVRNLESRGLVKKIPMGNTNKVVLK